MYRAAVGDLEESRPLFFLQGAVEPDLACDPVHSGRTILAVPVVFRVDTSVLQPHVRLL
jgi:hypothetical protein